MAGPSSLLSRPKPLRLELWQEADKAKVLGATMREGEAIYVWLQFPGTDEPRAITLPWDMKMAQAAAERHAGRPSQRHGRQHVEAL